MRKPKHILITGASSGLGASLALAYAAPGVRLSLHGRDKDRLSLVAGEARKRGAEVSEHIGDVASAPMMDWWVRECDRAAPIDLIIANAGISAGSGKLFETAEAARQIFATNVQGVLNTIHPALPMMTARKRGRIAIISSLASFRGFAGSSSYCASKAAVRVYGEALRADLAPHGVGVSVVCPGYITTPMTDMNKFPMPLIMTPQRAAIIIRRGLAANRPRIAFPAPMYALVRFLSILPQDFVNALTSRLPRKGE